MFGQSLGLCGQREWLLARDSASHDADRASNGTQPLNNKVNQIFKIYRYIQVLCDIFTYS